MLLEYPRIPRCQDCQRYMVDYSFADGTGSGEIVMLGPPGDKTKQRPLERPSHCPPVCKLGERKCPKGSPEREAEFLLTEANWQALKFYRETRATFGRGLSEEAANDGIVRRNFVILDKLFGELRETQAADNVSLSLHRLFARG
ncbi:MAG TPA: hypothetical protein VF278_19600 [Pirellulales bacterium]